MIVWIIITCHHVHSGPYIEEISTHVLLPLHHHHSPKKWLILQEGKARKSVSYSTSWLFHPNNVTMSHPDVFHNITPSCYLVMQLHQVDLHHVNQQIVTTTLSASLPQRNGSFVLWEKQNSHFLFSNKLWHLLSNNRATSPHSIWPWTPSQSYVV